MDNRQLFATALGLADPWYVESVELAPQELGGPDVLQIRIDFRKGATFPCSIDGCSHSCQVHDTVEKTWRHLNFFQYKTFLTARVPRLKCGDHGVRLAMVPWARPGSGFTLMFEALAIMMAHSQPMSQVGKILEEHDTRLWPMISKYVEKAHAAVDMSEVTVLGMDETSKKGHNYITVFADIQRKVTLDVQPGKDATTVGNFVEVFTEHNGIPNNVQVVTADMSLGFRKGILENFPKAKTVIDKFHVIKNVNDAVDKVRRAEARELPDLKRTKYLWLKNPSSLTEAQSKRLDLLMPKLRNKKTGRAYQMRMQVQQIYETTYTREEAELGFKKLCSWMMRSRIDEMKKCAQMIRNHFEEILNYWDHRFTNATLEGLNSIIQNIKVRARGFRNDQYFITMILLVTGGLNFDGLFDVAKWRPCADARVTS